MPDWRYILILLLLLPGFRASAVDKNGSRDKPRKNNDLAVIVAFPEKPIPLPTDPTIWNRIARALDFDGDDHWDVGHAGVILINGESGEAEYVDFGRYEDREALLGQRPENFGVVRSPATVPGFKIERKARIENNILVNLDTLLIDLAIKPYFRDYGRLEAAVYYDLDMDKMLMLKSELEEEGYIKYGCPTQQYCTRFVRQVIRRGGGKFRVGNYTGMQDVRYTRRLFNW